MDNEAEYNNRARVPEHMEIMGQWHEDAAMWRDNVTCALDMSYGPSPRSVLDIFEPEDTLSGAPLFMFIHGGYWQALDGKSASHMARGVNAHGFAMAVPTYDLCPDTTVPAIIDQLRQACLFLWRERRQRLVVCGHSAGGHLTAAMAATRWREIDGRAPEDLVTGAMPISGIFDLAPLIGTTINDKAGLTEASAREASPLLWPAPSGIAMTACVGELESAEFHRQSRVLAEDWGKTGNRTAYKSELGTNHFTVIMPLADPESAMTRELVALA